MKALSLFLLSLVTLPHSWAQFPACDTIPLKLLTDQIEFQGNSFFADSVITLPFVNNSTIGFAYPLARLEPTTPLPTGMTLHVNSEWQVFASAWNPGDTLPAWIEYYVTDPIPDNFEVNFQVLIRNLAPLPYDTCAFTSTITVNLNPQTIESIGLLTPPSVQLYPNPIQDYLVIESKSPRSLDLLLCDITGRVLKETTLKNEYTKLSLTHLVPGIYFVRVNGWNEGMKIVKL